MSYQLGIDVGTTYTAAAVCRSSDRRWVEPEVVTLGTRSAAVPSVLFMAPDGAVVVGDAAERRALTDPDRVVREFKRRIGDPTPVVVAGRAWAPEELSARLVRWVVDRVAEREGRPAAAIAVTHPASWGTHKKELFAGALRGQGLTVTFLAEPQAAALHYSAEERIPAGSTIAVYDLGGGTFDAAVVRKGDSGAAAAGAAGFGLLGRPEGLERLGGIDFDEVVFEHVRAGLPGAFQELDDSDPEVLSAVSRVRRECAEAKEALSSDTEVSIPVLLPASRGSVRLHRSEFESLIRPQVQETVAALRAAVASARVAPEQLTAVLLVGGSSRIPLVGQLVSEQLGRPVAVDADPKNAIAKGAALAVSPKPTASWPGVAIAPVPGGAVAGTLVSAAAPPPDRPPPPAPPRRRAPVGAPMPAAARAAAVAAAAPRGPVGPSHEPATSLLSGAGQVPAGVAHRPTIRPGPEIEPDPGPPAPRRSVGVFVGLGALVAVAAVVIALLSWREPPPEVGPSSGTPVSTVEVPAPPVAPEPGGAGEEDTPNEPTRRRDPAPDPDAKTGGEQGGGPNAPTDPGEGGENTQAPPTEDPEPPPDKPTSPAEPSDEGPPAEDPDAGADGPDDEGDPPATGGGDGPGGEPAVAEPGTLAPPGSGTTI